MHVTIRRKEGERGTEIRGVIDWWNEENAYTRHEREGAISVSLRNVYALCNARAHKRIINNPTASKANYLRTWSAQRLLSRRSFSRLSRDNVLAALCWPPSLAHSGKIRHGSAGVWCFNRGIKVISRNVRGGRTSALNGVLTDFVMRYAGAESRRSTRENVAPRTTISQFISLLANCTSDSALSRRTLSVRSLLPRAV